MATVSEVRRLLRPTTLPAELADDLLDHAAALWLMSEDAVVLAADLALCHPLLAPQEVRAAAAPRVPGAGWRLTVVAHDRPGLLADTAAALGAAGLSITSASVATWSHRDLALHSLTISGPVPARRAPRRGRRHIARRRRPVASAPSCRSTRAGTRSCGVAARPMAIG